MYIVAQLLLVNGPLSIQIYGTKPHPGKGVAANLNETYATRFCVPNFSAHQPHAAR